MPTATLPVVQTSVETISSNAAWGGTDDSPVSGTATFTGHISGGSVVQVGFAVDLAALPPEATGVSGITLTVTTTAAHDDADPLVYSGRLSVEAAGSAAVSVDLSAGLSTTDLPFDVPGPAEGETTVTGSITISSHYQLPE